MAAAGEASLEGLKEYLSRLAESNQICKVVIVSGLMVLFYDWGEQSASSTRVHTQPVLQLSPLIGRFVVLIYYIYPH